MNLGGVSGVWFWKTGHIFRSLCWNTRELYAQNREVRFDKSHQRLGSLWLNICCGLHLGIHPAACCFRDPRNAESLDEGKLSSFPRKNEWSTFSKLQIAEERQVRAAPSSGCASLCKFEGGPCLPCKAYTFPRQEWRGGSKPYAVPWASKWDSTPCGVV